MTYFKETQTHCKYTLYTTDKHDLDYISFLTLPQIIMFFNDTVLF